MINSIKVALAQIQSHQGDVDRNLEEMKNKIAQACDVGANLIVFPEMATTGYLIHDSVFELAEEIPGGRTIKLLEGFAKSYGITIAAGMPERAQEGVLYNDAVLVGPEGFLGKYRKILLPNHSCFNEKRYFRPATTTGSIDTSFGKVGMAICYDLFSPEITRHHALEGARIIICPSASPGVRQGFFEAFTQSRSMENGVFVIYVNQCGIQENLTFWGGSEVRSPAGALLLKLKYDVEDFGVVDLDLSGDQKRVRPFVPTLRDQPGWLYESLRERCTNL